MQRAIKRTAKAAIQAIVQCPKTTATAHFPPNSFLMDDTAATHGVYKRQNTSNDAASTLPIAFISDDVEPYRTDNVETTLSFAMKPVINAVDTFQSPKPSGLNTGAIHPAAIASSESCESDTTRSVASKF